MLTDKVKRLIDLPGGIKGGIEFEPGDIRFQGSSHPLTMLACYGHVRGFVKALDNRSWDFYAGDKLNSNKIFIVKQLKLDGTTDEYKLIFYTDSLAEARDLYFAHMPKELGFFGGIEEIKLEQLLAFKKITDSVPLNFDCELSDVTLSDVQPLSDAKDNLSDAVISTIRLSRAEWINENQRQYTSESMLSASDQANTLIDAGLVLVGYDDEDIRTNQEAGHPREVYTEEGEFVGYDYNQYEPAFKFNKFKFDQDNKELYASIEALEKLEAGKRFADKLRAKVPIKFSLRAMGGCQRIGDKEICEISKIEGGDAVKNPAMDDAEPLATYITDSKKVLSDAKLSDAIIPLSDAKKENSLKDCCSSCSNNKPCEKLSKKDLNKSIDLISQMLDKSTVKLLENQIKLTNNLGEKAHVVSPTKSKFIKLGDTIMDQEILEMIVNEADPETRKKLGAMAAKMGSKAMPAMPEVEAEKPTEKPKEDMPPAEKKEDPMMEKKDSSGLYDAKKIQEEIQKGIADGLKVATETIKAELETKVKSELSILDDTKAAKAIADAKKAVTDHLTTIVKANEFEGRKFDKYSEIQIQDAIDLASEKTTVEDCNKSLLDSFKRYDKDRARDIASGKITTTNAQGVTVILDEAEKNYKQPLGIILDAVDACEKERHGFRGRIHQQELAKINQPMIDQLWQARMKHPLKGKAIADWGKRAIKDTANPVTVDDLRNQEGVLSGIIERQTFQKLLGMQWVRSLGPSFARGDLGREFKILSTGFTPPTAGTARIDGEIREGEAYGESVSYQRFNKFFTKLRGRAIRIGKELQIALKTGVLKIDAVARLISDVSDEMARLTDFMILREIHTHIAEYGKVQVSAQAVAATEWTYSAGGAPTVNIGGDIGNVTFGTTVKGVAILLTGDNTTTTLHTANDRTVHPAPIVPGRTTVTVDDDGNETVTDNKDATVATLGGITQVEGHFINGDIVNKGDGTTATYAVAKELGVVVFKETAVSGAAAGVRPTITFYYDTNYDEFNLTPSANVKPEEHYSGIFRLVNSMSGIMSGTPNYANPDLMIQQTSVARGSVCNADLFENRKQPGGTVIDRGFADTQYITDLYGIDFMHGNGEFFGGARRAYLYERENMSAYFVSAGMNWSLQNQSTKAVGNIVDGVFYGDRNVPIPEWFWTCDLVDGVGTPTVLNTDGSMLQCKGRSIRYVGNLAVVRSS